MRSGGPAVLEAQRVWRQPYRLAPDQPRGVVSLDVVLHLRPDGQVGLHPVHVGLVPAREEIPLRQDPRRQQPRFTTFPKMDAFPNQNASLQKCATQTGFWAEC